MAFLWLLALVIPAYGATYEEATAKDAMIYSSGAYCPKGKVASWSNLNEECASRTTNFTTTLAITASPPPGDVILSREYFGYMGVDSERRWVVGAFKGTNGSMADFATDLAGGFFNGACVIDGVALGNVHEGFCNYFRFLHMEGFGNAYAALAEANPTHRPVLTGHSLGAAAAVVAGAFFNLKYGLNCTVYTYGQPRVGDAHFSKLFGRASPDSWRVVHAHDNIAHEPPCCAVFGPCRPDPTCPYHTDHDVLYDNDMHAGSPYRLCDGPEDLSCSHHADLNIDDHLHYFDVEVGDYCCFDDGAELLAQ
mmetsp:Transcript_47367/g.107378  ORF Transcript_47367/g.107378 Transcript_47367/m.107378 type:complete len:308 (+) Transcript_47367:64-987(+)